jgi:hypothetical protein
MLVRNLNGEALAERFDWAARPFWQDANPDRQRIFWDYLAHLEEEGMSIEDVYAKLDEEFARAREGVAALADHVDELAEVIEFR